MQARGEVALLVIEKGRESRSLNRSLVQWQGARDRLMKLGERFHPANVIGAELGLEELPGRGCRFEIASHRLDNERVCLMAAAAPGRCRVATRGAIQASQALQHNVANLL